jgi:hypothetical protein
MNKAKIALNQKACAKLQRLGVTLHSRMTLMRADGITPVSGLDLVELDRKFVRQLDSMRRNGDTYSHLIHLWWPK